MEWPASACLTAGLWKTFGGSLDVWGRAVSVALSVAAVAVLFLLVRRRHGRTAAIGAGYVLALSPVAIVVGQSFMLETSVVFLALATIYCVDRWRLSPGSRRRTPSTADSRFRRENGTVPFRRKCMARAGGRFTGAAAADEDLHARPAVAAGGDGARPGRWRAARRERLMAVVVLGAAIVPAAVWYGHAMRISADDHPLSVSVFYSVRDGAARHFPPHPLLFTPDFYRQVFDDLSTVVLTPVALMLPLVGLLDRSWRRWAAWLAAMAILMVALPRKFYEMNYYYVVILPPLCILAGLGWRRIVRRLRLGRVAIAAVLAARAGRLDSLRRPARLGHARGRPARSGRRPGGAIARRERRAGRDDARHGDRPVVLLRPAGLGRFAGGRGPGRATVRIPASRGTLSRGDRPGGPGPARAGEAPAGDPRRRVRGVPSGSNAEGAAGGRPPLGLSRWRRSARFGDHFTSRISVSVCVTITPSSS